MSDVQNPLLLEVSGLGKIFETSAGKGRGLRALDDVSFALSPGRTLGIVGESGSGKSTAARCLLRLIEPSSGKVLFEGTDIGSLPQEELRRFRRNMQIVFQDTTGTLDPRMTVGALIEEPLQVHGVGTKAERRERVAALLRQVGLDPSAAKRRPHEFSGGQRQRIGIARAIAIEPKLVVLDEPVSALDVSIQAQILNLLKDLQQQLGLSYVFIVHDLHVAEFFCDDILVLYLGEVMEAGPAEGVFRAPMHPYTASLISAIPTGHRAGKRQRIVLQGEIPTLTGERPKGCIFQPRCPIGKDRAICAETRPAFVASADGHRAACHFPGELQP